MANSLVGYIALLRQLAFFAKLGRRSLPRPLDSGKGLLHWKALQIEFEKCHFGKQLLSEIYSLAQVYIESF